MYTKFLQKKTNGFISFANPDIWRFPRHSRYVHKQPSALGMHSNQLGSSSTNRTNGNRQVKPRNRYSKKKKHLRGFSVRARRRFDVDTTLFGRQQGCYNVKTTVTGFLYRASFFIRYFINIYFITRKITTIT